MLRLVDEVEGFFLEVVGVCFCFWGKVWGWEWGFFVVVGVIF